MPYHAPVAAKGLLALIGSLLMWFQFQTPTQNPVHCFSHAGVAADAEICSKYGSDILSKMNGSAVDAAIATLLCVSLFNPHSMGIGGGAVFTIYNASTGKVEVIDARETAPMKANKTMFKDPQKTKLGKSRKVPKFSLHDGFGGKIRFGGLSIAIPGEIRGYALAHDRYGKLSWGDLFRPTIELARSGIKVSHALAEAIEEKSQEIRKNKLLCEVFCDSKNRTLKEDAIIKFPKLADTYEQIANHSKSFFYDGSLSQKIVKDIQAAGGIITAQDLKLYSATVHQYALNFTLRNYTFYAPTAPFGGPVLALVLKILNGYNFSASSINTKNKALTYHRIIEAFRHAYALRSQLGDPKRKNSEISKKINDTIKYMTSDKTAENIRKNISDSYANPDISYDSIFESTVVDSGTSHLSIIAPDGSAVAVTSSINDRFGSMVMSNSTGIIFNNQMNDFSFSEKEAKINNNEIEPGIKPLSSMCPTIILDNSQPKRVRMVVGASGGTRITTATALVILNHLFFDYDLEKAVAEPRFHNEWKPQNTTVETDFDKDVIKALKGKGHVISKSSTCAKVQAVARLPKKICAESDKRKNSYGAGFRSAEIQKHI